jgi:glycosyltransferase involved in cell wall biosynthesis
MRDRLDVLLTQYIAPPLFAGRQVVVIHDILFESNPELFPPLARWRNRLLVQFSARRAHSVLTPSHFSRDEIIRRYGIPAQRIAVAPIGVTPAPARNPTGESSILARLLGEDWNRPFLLFVGRIEPRKNVDLLLTACRRAHRADAMLVVVGRADFGADRTVAALRDEPSARHLVDVSLEDLMVLYRHARALVFPSVAEGFGIPILEALSLGTRVIHSNTTAIPEIGGRFTRMFDPNAPDRAEVLTRMINEEIDSLHSGSESTPGLSAHLEQFAWDRSARVLVDAVSAAS